MRISLDFLLLGGLLSLFGCGSAGRPVSPPPAAITMPGAAPTAGMPAPRPSAGTGGAPVSQSPAGTSNGAAGTAGMSAELPPAPGAMGGAGAQGATTAPEPPAGETIHCAPRMVSGDPQLHFHHVHFNTTDAEADVEFFMKFHNGMPIDFCTDSASDKRTRAIQTERGYFLFNAVATPPDPTLNSFVEHVGYLNTNPSAELRRVMALGVKLWMPGDNLQCMEVAMGMACFNNGYFYTQAPNGARIEVAGGPGPAKSGFGHIHLRGPIPDFYMKVLGPALMGMMDMALTQAQHVDNVNLTNAYLEGRPPENPVETRDKPISHFAYSTTDLMANLERIKAAGIEIQEDVSFKPEYGFKSFFIKSPEGVWVEIVEDSAFAPK